MRIRRSKSSDYKDIIGILKCNLINLRRVDRFLLFMYERPFVYLTLLFLRPYVLVDNGIVGCVSKINNYVCMLYVKPAGKGYGSKLLRYIEKNIKGTKLLNSLPNSVPFFKKHNYHSSNRFSLSPYLLMEKD